ncbi:metallophosphoesterase [Deinococcus sedimenti]|uniref:Serine/threonine protein phosphatase n=1 Tax=Deinococcus sedimenti TaxID=1867090 RepID=A0ABQ2SAS0_9DEIO|nr:metallophosphoesterase [Deinococcus sedimenti]GGS12152.1 serine/threonine protein phosphatase [Deinococcus sedimenti]
MTHPDPARTDASAPAPLTAPIAIGDVHGCLAELNELLAQISPDRHLVFLGDYVDRGPDNRGVLARVRALVEARRATALLGNHDQLMIDSLLNGDEGAREIWLRNGGQATLDNYVSEAEAAQDALWMQENLRPHVTIGPVLFSHAMRPDPTGQDVHAHLWGRPNTADTPLYPLPEGVTFSVHGHTPMMYGPVSLPLTDETVAVFIDTGCVFGRTLTAIDTATWQALSVPARPPMPTP